MNITCNRELLFDAIKMVSLVIPQKTHSRPLLNNLEFAVTEEKTLVITATDMEMGIKLNVPLESALETGKVLLPVTQLIGILGEVKEKNVKIETLERSLVISGCNFIYKLPFLGDTEFPEVPLLEGVEIKIDRFKLGRVIKDVAFAMNKDKNRYSLNSLLLCLEGKRMEAVATDQVRLAYSFMEIEKEVEGCFNIILPAKAVHVIESLLSSGGSDEISIICGDNQVTFIFEKGYFITRLVDAQFPKYRAAFDNYRNNPDILVNTSDLSEALRGIMLLTCTDRKNVALHIKEGLLTFKTSTPLGDGNVDVKVKYSDKEMSIGINPGLVQEFMREIENQKMEEVRIKVVGPMKPVILYSHENYIYFMSPTSY
ncbi:MAG: DNA polymerase III subunit beta [Planctomycetes bacterium]|nr:DNA polymerase III subunit beta [Planctomycetota bacterium]